MLDLRKGLFTPWESECESKRNQSAYEEDQRKILNIKENFRFRIRLVWMDF